MANEEDDGDRDGEDEDEDSFASFDENKELKSIGSIKSSGSAMSPIIAQPGASSEVSLASSNPSIMSLVSKIERGKLDLRSYHLYSFICTVTFQFA